MSNLDNYIINNKSGNYHLGKLFLDCMRLKPADGIFQIDAATGAEETNGSVLCRTKKLATCYKKFGLKPGDVVALGGNNHLDLHIPYYAGLLSGLPVVGVDPYFKYDEIYNLFKLTEPKIAFCQQKTHYIHEKAAKDVGIDVKIVTFDGDYTLSNFMEEYGDDEDAENFQPAEFDTDKTYAWLVSTSGTTGLPKVAAFKHQCLINQMLIFVQMASVPSEKTQLGLNLSPVQWISSYYNALAMPLLNQVKLQTSKEGDIGHIIDVINKYKPVHAMVSPSTMAYILSHKKPCDLTCFNMLTLTGAKIYKEQILEVKARLRPGAVLMEAYGQTETIGPCLMPNPRGPVGNCGVPMPSTLREVKLVDPDTGAEVTDLNVPGELWTRGPSFSEYYNSPEETEKAFTEDGWLKTGDLLYRDQNNNYFFVERIKMLIKYKNYHINPHELEELIVSQLKGVLEVCVVGLPHKEDSQHAVACVVRQPGAAVTAQEIKDLIANNLAPSKQLRGGVVFLDALPKTSTGKVARAKLSELILTAANRE